MIDDCEKFYKNDFKDFCKYCGIIRKNNKLRDDSSYPLEINVKVHP